MAFPKPSWSKQLRAKELCLLENLSRPYPRGSHLLEQGPLVFLQLLLESRVGADVGAGSLGGSQAALPAQLCHCHRVCHQDGGAAGHPSQAGMAPGARSGRGESRRNHRGMENPSILSLGCEQEWGGDNPDLQACPTFWMLRWSVQGPPIPGNVFLEIFPKVIVPPPLPLLSSHPISKAKLALK